MLLKRSLTGKYQYFLSDTGLKIVRCDRFRRDFDASQPRDADGKWTKGGRVLARPSKTVEVELDKHHPEVLAKKSLAQLREIAKEVGAKEPTKFISRKSSWIDEIQKAKDQPTSQTENISKSLSKRQPQSLDHEELVASGKKFSDKFLKGNQGIVGFERLDQAIRSQSGVSKDEAMNMAKRTRFDLHSVPWESIQQTRQHLSSFFELTGGRGSTSITKITRTNDRAFAKWEGIVNIGSYPTADVLFHEFGHHIEFEDNNITLAAAKWRNSRETPGTRVEKLSKITGNPDYRDDEVAVQDKFIDPYVGKVYPRNPQGKSATEVISMGIEHFANPELMQHLHEKDPQHFHFIVGLLVHK